jgi:type II secretory pathway pseudopilin PulG
MTDTTSGTGVGGNTPAATQQANQQQATAQRNDVKVEIPVKLIPWFLWPTIAAVVLFVVNYYEWTFFWTVSVSLLVAFTAYFLKKKWWGDLTTPHKPLIGQTLNALIVISIIVAGFTLAQSSFTMRVAEAVDRAESCVGGDEAACNDLRFTQRQVQPIAVVPAEWEEFVAPPAGEPPLLIDLGSDSGCWSDDPFNMRAFDTDTNNAYVLVNSTTSQPVTFYGLIGSRSEILARELGCAEFL